MGTYYNKIEIIVSINAFNFDWVLAFHFFRKKALLLPNEICADP